jgi:hypothetical protein
MDAKNSHTSDEAVASGKKRGRKKAGEPKVALNLRLDQDVHTQLKVHALLSKSTASDIVADLVRKHLRVYTVSGPESGGREGAA